MLVLSRHLNERIMIGEGENLVTIVVVDIRPDRARIGIEAPDGVSIHREEVFDAIQRERQRAEAVMPGKTLGTAVQIPRGAIGNGAGKGVDGAARV